VVTGNFNSVHFGKMFRASLFISFLVVWPF